MTALLHYALISNIWWLIGCVYVRQTNEKQEAEGTYCDLDGQYIGVFLVGLIWPAVLVILAITTVFAYIGKAFNKINSMKVF
jgi:hypothetical protein